MQTEINTKIATLEAELAELKQLLNPPIQTINYWQPKLHEKYYYVTPTGKVSDYHYTDVGVRYRVFQTEAEAQKYADYVKTEEIIRKAIAKANEGWLPNWSIYEDKYSIEIDTSLTSKLEIITDKYRKGKPTFLYIKSREHAEQLAKTYEQEFITYLSH